MHVAHQILYIRVQDEGHPFGCNSRSQLLLRREGEILVDHGNPSLGYLASPAVAIFQRDLRFPRSMPV